MVDAISDAFSTLATTSQHIGDISGAMAGLSGAMTETTFKF